MVEQQGQIEPAADRLGESDKTTFSISTGRNSKSLGTNSRSGFSNGQPTGHDSLALRESTTSSWIWLACFRGTPQAERADRGRQGRAASDSLEFVVDRFRVGKGPLSRGVRLDLAPARAAIWRTTSLGFWPFVDSVSRAESNWCSSTSSWAVSPKALGREPPSALSPPWRTRSTQAAIPARSRAVNRPPGTINVSCASASRRRGTPGPRRCPPW